MKNILIIEDDPIVAHVFERMLTREGYATAIASNGAQGLDRVMSFEPDAVLLDLMMPTLGGFVVLKALRALPAYHHLPVIVVTNHATPEFREKALNAGANHILDKASTGPSEIIPLLQLAMGGVPASRLSLYAEEEARPRF